MDSRKQRQFQHSILLYGTACAVGGVLQLAPPSWQGNTLLLTKRRKPKSLTQPDPAAQIGEDLVKRDFTAFVPNEKWLTDITEMACKDGKLYLCAILDCFDGAIVGHSMDDT